MNLNQGMKERVIGESERPGARTATDEKLPADTEEVVAVRALLLGERLDTRALERNASLGVAPLTVNIPDGGVAVLFRYGAVVLFGAATAELDNFVVRLRPLVTARCRYLSETTRGC